MSAGHAMPKIESGQILTHVEEAPVDRRNFDRFRQRIAAGPTRRRLLTVMAGGLFAGLPIAGAIEESVGKAKKGKRRKNKKRKPNAAPGTAPAASAPVSRPSVRIDAFCLAPGAANASAASGDASFAQTFTAVASGRLVSAEVFVRKAIGSAGDYVLELGTVDGAGAPTATVLAAATVDDADVPAGVVAITFDFPTSPLVEAGTTYALMLSRPDSMLEVNGHTRDTCGGRAYIRNAPAGQFAPALIADIAFTTFVSSYERPRP